MAKSEISFEQARQMLVLGGKLYTNKKNKSDVVRAIQIHFTGGFKLYNNKTMMSGYEGDYIYQNETNQLGVMFRYDFASKYVSEV